MFLPPLRAGLSPSSCLAGGLGTPPVDSTQGQHPAPWAHRAELCCPESCLVRGSASCSTSGQTLWEQAERIKKQNQPKRRKKKKTKKHNEKCLCASNVVQSCWRLRLSPDVGTEGGTRRWPHAEFVPLGRVVGGRRGSLQGKLFLLEAVLGPASSHLFAPLRAAPLTDPCPPSSASPQREGSTNPVPPASGVLVSPVFS